MEVVHSALVARSWRSGLLRRQLQLAIGKVKRWSWNRVLNVQCMKYL